MEAPFGLKEDQLKYLLSKLERGEASQSLDVEIADLLFGGEKQIRAAGIGWGKDTLLIAENNQWVPLPSYTSVIDSAMSLIPDRWKEGKIIFSGGDYHVSLSRSYPLNAETGTVTGDTLSIAICAAAIKARMIDEWSDLTEKRQSGLLKTTFGWV